MDGVSLDDDAGDARPSDRIAGDIEGLLAGFKGGSVVTESDFARQCHDAYLAVGDVLGALDEVFGDNPEDAESHHSRSQKGANLVGVVHAFVDRVLATAIDNASELGKFVKPDGLDSSWSLLMVAASLVAPIVHATSTMIPPPLARHAPFFADAIHEPFLNDVFGSAGILHTRRPIHQWDHSDVWTVVQLIGVHRQKLPVDDPDNALTRLLKGLLLRSLQLCGAGMTPAEEEAERTRVGTVRPREKETHPLEDIDQLRRLAPPLIKFISAIKSHRSRPLVGADTEFSPDLLQRRRDAIYRYVTGVISTMNDGAVRRMGFQHVGRYTLYFPDVEVTRRIEIVSDVKTMHVLLRSKPPQAQVEWSEYRRTVSLKELIANQHQTHLYKWICCLQLTMTLIGYLFKTLNIKFVENYVSSMYDAFVVMSQERNVAEPTIVDFMGRLYVYFGESKFLVDTPVDAAALWASLVLQKNNGDLGRRNATLELRRLLAEVDDIYVVGKTSTVQNKSGAAENARKLSSGKVSLGKLKKRLPTARAESADPTAQKIDGVHSPAAASSQSSRANAVARAHVGDVGRVQKNEPSPHTVAANVAAHQIPKGKGPARPPAQDQAGRGRDPRSQFLAQFRGKGPHFRGGEPRPSGPPFRDEQFRDGQSWNGQNGDGQKFFGSFGRAPDAAADDPSESDHSL